MKKIISLLRTLSLIPKPHPSLFVFLLLHRKLGRGLGQAIRYKVLFVIMNISE